MAQQETLIFAASGIAKQAIAQAVKDAGGEQVEVHTMSDMQAAMAVRQKKAHYFIGSCSTGQGGALSMARAILGDECCMMLTERGLGLDAEKIRDRANGSYLAFGISADHAATAIPILVQSLLEKHQRGDFSSEQ